MAKNVLFITVLLVSIVLSFSFGKNIKSSQNKDALLAYEHYYEIAEYILKDSNCKVDSLTFLEYELSKSEIDSITRNYVLQWPEIIDQRDQLSDVIRVTKDRHPEIANEIDKYLRVYFEDPYIINNWCYSY